MLDLRAEHQQEMRAWYEEFGGDPSSADAQAALQKLRAEHWDDMQGLFDQYGVEMPQRRGPGKGGVGSAGCGGACSGGAGYQGAAYGAMGDLSY